MLLLVGILFAFWFDGLTHIGHQLLYGMCVSARSSISCFVGCVGCPPPLSLLASCRGSGCLAGGALTSSIVESNSSLSVKVVVPFQVYCSSVGMSVVVRSSLTCDTSSVCMLIACVVLYGSSVDVGGCSGPSLGIKSVLCGCR